MRAARVHAHQKPLVLGDVPVSDIQPDEILVTVTLACAATTVTAVDSSSSSSEEHDNAR